MKQNRIPLALGAFVLWVLITLVGSRIKSGGQAELADAVTKGLAWPILAAGVFICAVVLWRGWTDVGLNRLPRPRDLLLAWLPLAYITVALGFVVALGLPPMALIGWVFLNCLLVGFSEELMFRGVLLQAFRHRISVVTSVLLASVMFGAVHSLNAFGTGDLPAALIQSVAAFLSGLIFMALRLRSGSLWLPILVHGLWDFATFLLGMAGSGAAAAAELAEPSLAAMLVPILFVTPNALLGLWLMRHIARDNANPAT